MSTEHEPKTPPKYNMPLTEAALTRTSDKATKAELRDRVAYLEAMNSRLLSRLVELESRISSQDLALDLVSNIASEDKEASLTDELTGLPNRRALAMALAGVHERALAEEVPYAVGFIDLDNFSTINKHFSHDFGDDLLQQIGAQLQYFAENYHQEEDVLIARGRLEDKRTKSVVAGRRGGDEFVVIIPLHPSSDSLRLHEAASHGFLNLQTALENFLHNDSGQKILNADDLENTNFGFSVGYEVFEPGNPDGNQRSVAEVLNNADAAMLKHKARKKKSLRRS